MCFLVVVFLSRRFVLFCFLLICFLFFVVLFFSQKRVGFDVFFVLGDPVGLGSAPGSS